MPVVKVPALLKYYLRNQTEVRLSGDTVSEVLDDLVRHYPAIQPHLFDSNGKLRRHINLFVNTANIRDLDELDTPVDTEDIVKILLSVTGG